MKLNYAFFFLETLFKQCCQQWFFMILKDLSFRFTLTYFLLSKSENMSGLFSIKLSRKVPIKTRKILRFRYRLMKKDDENPRVALSFLLFSFFGGPGAFSEGAINWRWKLPKWRSWKTSCFTTKSRHACFKSGTMMDFLFIRKFSLLEVPSAIWNFKFEPFQTFKSTDTGQFFLTATLNFLLNHSYHWLTYQETIGLLSN